MLINKHTKRILIVDDDEVFRITLVRALSSIGHNVVGASDGVEALDLFNSYGAKFDLVITDAVMPNMDGITLSNRIAELYPDIPIILMTGYHTQRERAKAMEKIIQQVIEKPFDVSYICRITQSVFDKITAHGYANDNIELRH